MALAKEVGTLASIWRYPVKSMRGEALESVDVSSSGLSGDRDFALLDLFDGRIATAKNPRKWPNLFAFAARLEPGLEANSLSSILRITLPDGRVVTGVKGAIDGLLSEALHRNVSLVTTQRPEETCGGSSRAVPSSVNAEAYWPDIEGLDHRDAVTEFELPAGTFFDGATIHLLTTTTLESLRKSYPQGRFEVQRFRPNLVVNADSGEDAFPEDSWIGQVLSIGDHLRLSIVRPCGRCVMTTLAQGDLPMDSGILKTIIQQKRGLAGVYASVLRGGPIRRGDRIQLIGS